MKLHSKVRRSKVAIREGALPVTDLARGREGPDYDREIRTYENSVKEIGLVRGPVVFP